MHSYYKGEQGEKFDSLGVNDMNSVFFIDRIIEFLIFTT
jgi:hypothetical protein